MNYSKSFGCGKAETLQRRGDLTILWRNSSAQRKGVRWAILRKRSQRPEQHKFGKRQGEQRLDHNLANGRNRAASRACGNKLKP
jgi:hypothetical protein